MHVAALLLVAATGLLSAQDARVALPMPPFRAGLPPELVAMGRQFLVQRREDEHTSLRVFASVDPSAKTVDLGWRYNRDKTTSKSIRTRTSTIDFPGIPTALCPFGDSVLIVAGEGIDRRTIVERIELGEAEIDPETGVPKPGVPTARRIVYRADEPGRPVIADFCGLPGKHAKELTALRWDEPEILAFDPEAGSFRRLAALQPFGAAGVLEVPELARTYHSISGRDHRRLGYVLVLGTAMYDFVGEKDCTLVIVDGDRDGTFDRSMLLDSEGWGREGLSDPKAYVD
jgi:hypothetical protein